MERATTAPLKNKKRLSGSPQEEARLGKDSDAAVAAQLSRTLDSVHNPPNRFENPLKPQIRIKLSIAWTCILSSPRFGDLRARILLFLASDDSVISLTVNWNQLLCTQRIRETTKQTEESRGEIH